ncbi:unnamed protein product [Paramecium primaurelia]|uniref:Transmembrane protein n=1 Tax=Paramecium primaurelia TaxID=5886 RepID=A0A8S1QHW0_PARPR|nr:unnamed protein product [Paramecium primaurelia]
MMSILAIALCITLITSTTFNLYQICNCTQLIFQYDCLSAGLVCNWDYDNNECYDKPCQDIYYQTACLQQPQRCYWSAGCYNFTQCGDLYYTSSFYSVCHGYNYYCPEFQPPQCTQVYNIHNCSSIDDPNICNYYQSLEGICIWTGIIGQGCTLAQSCAQFFNNATRSCPQRFCYYSQDKFETCAPIQCSNYLEEIQCAQGIQTFGPYLKNIVGCYWNSEQNVCQEYAPSQMTHANCYPYSRGTYHWSNTDEKKGNCVPCSQQLLIISIILTILI